MYMYIYIYIYIYTHTHIICDSWFFPRHRTYTHIHIQICTHALVFSQESILAEPGGLPRMRNFRQKWQQTLRWEVDDRGGEFFDQSFTEVGNMRLNAYYSVSHG
jgi:hypothetical protein